MTPLTDLLNQLEVAVRAGDRMRALDLTRRIQQQLVRESHDQAATERRLRELLAELDRPAPSMVVKGVDLLGTVRSIKAVEANEGTVYPVWFGTNRKPDGRGGFGAERHDRTTRGRAEVLIPEGHRFGETGSPFWKKLLRFDLRDDTLRLQRVATQEPDAWLGHSYFAQAEPLLHDIHDLMRLDAAPGKRQRVLPAVDGGVSFWKLRR
jgi:hypothetical protein